jgi:hypothetical protein
VAFAIPVSNGQPRFRGGRELAGLAGFRNGYDLVSFQAGDPPRRYRLWLRRSSRKVGIQIGMGRIWMPPQLFATGEGSVATEDARGRLVTLLPPAAVGRSRVRLKRGTWRVRAISDAGQVDLRVARAKVKRGKRPAAAPVSSQSELSVRVPRTGDYLVEVRSAGARAALIGVQIERVAGPTRRGPG